METLKQKTRYYAETGKVDSTIDLHLMEQQVHALFCQWTKHGYLERDFIAAIEHHATIVYGSYLLEGEPELTVEQLLPETLESLDPFIVSPKVEGPKPRFYDENGELNGWTCEGDTMRPILVQLFVKWCVEGNFVRDFISALKDAASSTYYNYDICKGLGGLGGCQSVEQFLNTRPERKIPA